MDPIGIAALSKESLAAIGQGLYEWIRSVLQLCAAGRQDCTRSMATHQHQQDYLESLAPVYAKCLCEGYRTRAVSRASRVGHHSGLRVAQHA